MKSIRPVEPTPQDFGLTDSRISKFENPVKLKLPEYISIIPLYAAPLVAGIYAYTKNQTINFIIFISFSACLLAFLLTAIVAVAVYLLIWVFEAIWRRLQGDYSNYVGFKNAKKKYTIELNEWLKNQEAWWQSLSGREFEIELGLFFKKQGYKVNWTGKAGDQGVDLILFRDEKTIIVQCKAHRKPIGPGPIRDLYGALLHKRCDEAWLISTWGFTKKAEEFAKGKPIQLFPIKSFLIN